MFHKSDEYTQYFCHQMKEICTYSLVPNCRGVGGGGGIANFRQPPILKDLDNFPPGAFYSPHPRSTPIIVKVCSVSY